MEYAKDEVFNIRYNAEKDKLEYGRSHGIVQSVKKNKFLTLLITLGMLFASMNFILIYYFICILNNL